MMNVTSITCLLFSDLSPWEREGILPLLHLLGRDHEVKIEEMDIDRPRTFKGADGRGVFWVFAHRWEHALAALPVPQGSRIIVSALSATSSWPLLPALFWQKLRGFPQNVQWLAHSPLSFRFLCEIRGIAQNKVAYLPLPFAASGKRPGEMRRDRVTVGVIGRYSPDVNLHYALNVAHYVLHRKSSAHFMLLGTGPLEKHLRAVIDDLGLQSCVTLASPELTAIDDLDLLLYSPLQNQHFFPVTLAGSRGIPVVASELPGIDTYVLDGRTGFVVPVNETKPMAELVLRLTEDRNLRKSLGRKLESHLGSTLAAERLAEDYRGIIEGKAIPPRAHSEAA